jgi:hypothetical protein
MLYQELVTSLVSEGYQRVERDDRLLDVLPTQTREKGIELWEKNEPTHVKIIRLSFPYQTKDVHSFVIPRLHLEHSLTNNSLLKLEDYLSKHTIIYPNSPRLFPKTV